MTSPMPATPPAEGELVTPLSEEQARTITAEIRHAIDRAERAIARLADLVHRAHSARVWLPLGYGTWEEYARTEFGISRSYAYRLVDIATAARAIISTTTALGLSLTGDTGLSGRALLDVRGRIDQVAEALTHRLHDVPDLAGLAADHVRELLAAAVAEVRAETTSLPLPDNRLTDALEAVGVPPLAAADIQRWRTEFQHENSDLPPDLRTDLRQFAIGLRIRDARMGACALEIAPAHMADTDAAPLLAPLTEQTGETSGYLLACRRYVMTGDYRAISGHEEQLDETGPQAALS